MASPRYLIPRTCECVTLHGRSDLTGVIIVENFGMGISWVGQIWSQEFLKTEKEDSSIH